MTEFELIARYFTQPMPSNVLGVGDDCALLTPSSGMQLAVSTDTLIEGRHFFADVPPEDLGHKALAVNLSDLAACGADPFAFTLALSLVDIDEAWMARFVRGLFDSAKTYACPLIGGDTTRGPNLSITITVLGQVPPGAALLRSGAKPGDGIYVSGTLGDARYALQCLEQGTVPDDSLLAHLTRPTPRLELGKALRHVASAALDLSDGLVGDLSHILDLSQVGALIDTEALFGSDAISPAIRALGFDPAINLALSGGDDYELLFTASACHEKTVLNLRSQLNLPINRIGTIEQELGIRYAGHCMPSGYKIRGFDHFEKN